MELSLEKSYFSGSKLVLKPKLAGCFFVCLKKIFAAQMASFS